MGPGAGELGVMLTPPLLYLLFWHQILSSCVFLLVHVLFMLLSFLLFAGLPARLLCKPHSPKLQAHLFMNSSVMPYLCLVVMVTCQNLLKSKLLSKIYRSHCHLPHLLTPHHLSLTSFSQLELLLPSLYNLLEY